MIAHKLIALQGAVLEEFRRITEQIRKERKPSTELYRKQTYLAGKLDGLTDVLKILQDGIEEVKE
jgi:hypothetical protein